jgi:hypothetical protein
MKIPLIIKYNLYKPSTVNGIPIYQSKIDNAVINVT